MLPINAVSATVGVLSLVLAASAATAAVTPPGAAADALRSDERAGPAQNVLVNPALWRQWTSLRPPRWLFTSEVLAPTNQLEMSGNDYADSESVALVADLMADAAAAAASGGQLANRRFARTAATNELLKALSDKRNYISQIRQTRFKNSAFAPALAPSGRPYGTPLRWG